MTLLYNKDGIRAFDLRCDLGYFRIVDYSYVPFDREIFWGTEIKKIHTGCEEYVIADSLINAYIRGVYEKLNPKNRKNWPLV